MNCKHAGCMCEVAEDQEFCSDHCRDHAAMADHLDHTCGCGHPACQM